MQASDENHPWGRLCLTYKKSVLAVLMAITAIAVSQLPSARFDNALENWFVADDPALLAHRRLIDTFGSDELIIVGFKAADVFTPEVLHLVNRVTQKLEQAPHVEKVFSLTNIESVEGDGDELRIHDLVEFPLDETALEEVRTRALRNEMYVGNVVSADGTFTAMVVRLPHRADDFSYKIEAIDAIRAILAEEEPRSFLLVGGPVLDEQFFLAADHDSKMSASLMIAALILVLGSLLRSWIGVVLPLVTVILSVVWTYGWITLSGSTISVMTSMLPPLLLAAGIADSMHYLVTYQGYLATGRSQSAALHAAYAELMRPMTLTSATTAIGMFSLLVSRVQSVREFGVFGGIGVAGAFLLSVTLVPIVASYLPPMNARADARTALPRSTAMLEAVHAFTRRRQHLIFLVWFLLLLIGVVGASRIKAESAFLEYFKDGAAIKTDTRTLERELGGALTIDVIIDSGEDGGIKDPDVLRKIAALQSFLEQSPKVTATQSVTQTFKDMRRAFFANDQAEYKLPATREEAAQYLLLYEMDAPDGDIQEFVTFDNRAARVSARILTTTSRDAVTLVEATEAYVGELFGADAEQANVTGIAVLYANMEDYIRVSLIRGFSAALLAIFLLMCLQLRSIALGALAMVPNLIPIVICMGVMGFAEIRLDSMTAMVASISIGLAVDDSIHFMARVSEERGRGTAMAEALRRATTGVGRALVYTSICLCAGFASMLTGSFVGTFYFGILCLLTIVFALAADLLLLPVLLLWYDRAAA